MSPRLKAVSGHESSMSLRIADDKRCIVVEESDEDEQSGGFILYTNSAPAVRTFRTPFDIQWRELVLVDSLLLTGKQRDEFISVDAQNQKESMSVKVSFKPTGKLMVNADQVRISQVVYNMLDNALKFASKGETKVSAIKSGQGVEVSVKDEGTCISPKVMSRPFEKVVTASDSGIGIGLYLSKAITETHGSRIWAENNKDKGATFGFIISAI